MILHDLISYETLRLIWWVLLGVLLIGFAVMDGFDLGAAMLLPFVARTDLERRVVLNTVGPVWEGNQVWLILGGGAIFAAWPPLYAVSFSGFYLAMFAILFALILRPVGFKYRSKRERPVWRQTWDWALFVGGLVPALVMGVAVGNVLQGVPFHFESDLRIIYDGTTLLELLNPYGLLCGLLSVAMLIMHGAGWIALKADGVVVERARKAGSVAAIATMVLFVLGGVWLWLGVDAYRVVGTMPHDGASNPLAKTVEQVSGGWFANYGVHPWMLVAPVLGFAGAILTVLLARFGRPGLGFISSSLALTGVILTAGFSMFPFLMPSSSDPNSSLLLWDATSSHLTLQWMFAVTVFFLPIILLYTSWVFSKRRGTVTVEGVQQNTHSLY